MDISVWVSCYQPNTNNFLTVLSYVCVFFWACLSFHWEMPREFRGNWLIFSFFYFESCIFAIQLAGCTFLGWKNLCCYFIFLLKKCKMPGVENSPFLHGRQSLNIISLLQATESLKFPADEQFSSSITIRFSMIELLTKSQNLSAPCIYSAQGRRKSRSEIWLKIL